MQMEWKTRLCQVGEKLGYFHVWEHYSKPLEASPMIGGAPAGVFSKVFVSDVWIRLIFISVTRTTNFSKILMK